MSHPEKYRELLGHLDIVTISIDGTRFAEYPDEMNALISFLPTLKKLCAETRTGLTSNYTATWEELADPGQIEQRIAQYQQWIPYFYVMSIGRIRRLPLWDPAGRQRAHPDPARISGPPKRHSWEIQQTVAWSHDGRFVFVVKAGSGTEATRSLEIWQVPLDGTAPRNTGIRWSDSGARITHISAHPDGRRLALSTNLTSTTTWVLQNLPALREK